jgi:S-(hydroxymethyl)glutathione dehydrogenase / alcohol dehydrogenase
VVSRAGEPPIIEEITWVPMTDDEVRVRLISSGICHTDVAWAAGELFPEFPVVLGHESAGIVVAVGRKVRRVREGSRVALGLSHHCGHCFYCETGRPMLCDQRTLVRPRILRDGRPILQGFGTGGFAEEVIVGEMSVVPIPEGVPMDVAAVVGCATSTGLGAVLTLAAVPGGSRVLVLGAGGVGLNIVMGCKLAGVERIVVADPNPGRRSLAMELGATDQAESSDEPLRELEPEGFEYVFESVGRPEAMELATRMTAKGGTCVLIGAPPPDTVIRLNALEIIGQQKRLLGCLTGNVRPDIDFERYFRLYLRGKLDLDKLITNRISLDDINKGFQMTREHQGVRTIVRMSEE